MITSVVELIQFQQNKHYQLQKDVEYAINFKTLLSGSFVTSYKELVRAYLSSSDFTQELLTASGSAIYKTRQNISQNILATNCVRYTT